jgi:endoglucanase
MRAADDLAGCAASLAALLHAAESPSPGAVYGLFTRAEEDGLIGARLAAADGLLPVGTVIVSVESSHALSGAEIGGGPVIRVGDRITTFDGSAEAHLQAAAERLRKADVEFQFQRQLMGGGVCEASAFAAFGYAVTGLAFPLGNYHNGLYENVVEAEYIDRRDFIAGARLLAEALEHAGAEASPANKDRLRRRPDDQARRLSESS